MLEQLLIFTRGGLILWTCKELGNALKGSPTDTLIRSCLLEKRSGATSYNYDAPGASYSLKLTFHNDLGLVFVAVYQRILHLLYVEDLLAVVKREFSLYYPKRTVYGDFDETFKQLKFEAEARAEDLKKSNPVVARKQQATLQGQGHKPGFEGKKNGGALKNDDGDGKKGNKLENGRFVVANDSNLKKSSDGNNNHSVKKGNKLENGHFVVANDSNLKKNSGGNNNHSVNGKESESSNVG
ncbi:Signal recognition particle receptor, alpha subunit, N-terminal [Sesbania bispinosa]|nr:Signal recognition particle receptor, alpha subunit, N-terminal [Sesbania bispinosa]